MEEFQLRRTTLLRTLQVSTTQTLQSSSFQMIFHGDWNLWMTRKPCSESKLFLFSFSFLHLVYLIKFHQIVFSWEDDFDGSRLASEKLPPISGLYKLKKWIQDRGLKTAAVTNAPRPNAELMISTLGLSDFFQVLIIGGECEKAKPHPDPYLKALDVLKASKDHTIIFEVFVFSITHWLSTFDTIFFF